MKIKNFIRHTMLLALACAGVFMTSCSTNECETAEDKIHGYFSDNTDMVMKIDLERALGTLDIQSNEDGQLSLPSDLNSLLTSVMSSSDMNDLRKLLDFKGFDWNNAVVGMRYGNLGAGRPDIEMLMVFSVLDDDQFAESIKSLSESRFTVGKEGDYMTIGDDKGAIMVDGRVGYIAISSNGVCTAPAAANMIDAWKEDADKTPMAEWKVNYVATERMGTMLMSMAPIMQAAERQDREMMSSVPSALKNGYVGVTFDIQDATVSMSMAWLDEKGGKINVPGLRNCDPSLMKYANGKDWLVACAGIGDLTIFKDNLIKASRGDRDVAAFCDQWLGKLSNSAVMFAAGPMGLEAFTSPSPSKWHMVLAVRFDNRATADELFAMVASNAGASASAGEFTARIPYDTDYDYSTGQYTEVYMNIYGKLDGATIILSTQPVTSTGGCKIPAAEFTGKTVAVVAQVDKSDAILSQFAIPVGFKATLTGNGSEANGAFTITGTDKKFFKALMGILAFGSSLDK